MGRIEHRFLDTMPPHVVGRQVDTACQPIAFHVLPEVDQLQSGADRVGKGHPLGVAAAFELQDDSPHGIGRAATVVEEGRAVEVAGDRLILLESIEQIGKQRDREPGLPNRLGERHKNRMVGPAGEAPLESLPPGRERNDRLGWRRRLIGKVVAPAGKRIDIGEVLPQPGRHEPGGDRKVFIVPTGDAAAEGFGLCQRASGGWGHDLPGRLIAAGGSRGGSRDGRGGVGGQGVRHKEARLVGKKQLHYNTGKKEFPAMKILLVSPRGFCAGVNMAIETLETAIRLHGTPVYVFHEIVHNKHVVDRFTREGAVFVDTVEEVPEGAVLLFSAHGVAPDVRRVAAERRLRAIDATCPLVTKVHLEAIKYAKAGYRIMLIGHEGHDEVIGTIGQAPDAFTLVETTADVDSLPFGPDDKLAYLTQTTLSVDDASRIICRLKERFPQIVGPPKDDICYATQNRQEAVRVLSDGADIVLVLGSQNSSNSQRLAELARDGGIAAHLIDGANEINPVWFSGDETVLITAGASAPESVVQDCVEWLKSRYAATVDERTIREEEVYFPLPKELRAAAAAVQLPIA